MIEVRVLGPLEVLRGDQPVHIPGEKERALLGLLAMQPGKVMSADQLIDQLWGDALPTNAANALQAVVSRLRRALGEDGVVVTKKPGYALQIAPEAIDATRFEGLLVRARQLDADDAATASRLLTEALRLWRGSPYADFAYEDFAREERARLEDLHVSVLEEKIAADLSLGRNGEALARLERLIPAYPLREGLRGLLMLALYRAGRQGDAIAAYQETRRVLNDDLGLDPGPELEDIYKRILQHDPSLQPRSDLQETPRLTNLRTRITTFVGRETEIVELTSILREQRLVTVIGPGGAGKTSLAVEVARGLVDSFDRGVWLVELAPVPDEALVVATISDALGMAEDSSPVSQSSPIFRLTEYLKTRNLLLVLDNCEHVVQAVAEVTDELLSTCPGVTILATSREVLGSSGEFVWTIPPLSLPETEADLRELSLYDSVQLFEQRVASAGGVVEIEDEESAASVLQICTRLDGLPLAIELAAARARWLPLPEIARRLDQRFALLSAVGRTTEPRHRTLHAAIDWSHDLLSPPEAALFRRLGVFSGGWTLEAAEVVCGDEAVTDVLDALGRLVDQSLVGVQDGRFSMLETILAYARERLDAAGEEETIRERHARFFLAMAESVEPALRGNTQARALKRLRDEEHNLRLALQWAREHPEEDPDLGLGLASALGWYWYVGRQGEGRSELRSMLDACAGTSGRTRARALQALSLSLRPAGCIVHASPEAAEVARESKAIFDQIGDAAGSAMSQLLVAVEGVAGVEVDSSLSMVEEARVTLREHGDTWGMALADFVEMEIRLYHDSTDQALVLGEQAAQQFDALDDDWGRSAVRLHLGFGLRQAGRTREAREVLQEAVKISRETGLPYNLARSLAELGELSVYEGDPDDAERWFQECDEILTDLADDAMQALVASGRGDAARYRVDPAAAIDLYDDALSLYRRSAVTRGIARALIGLAATSLDVDERVQAREHLDEGLALARDGGDPAILATALEQQARLSQRGGDEDTARALLLESEDLRRRYRRPRGALASRDLDSGLMLLTSDV